MCMCGDSILRHVIPLGEDRASHCLNPACDCTEYIPNG